MFIQNVKFADPTTGRLSKDGHLGGVATKRFNVARNPFQGFPLIQESHVRLSSWKARRIRETKDCIFVLALLHGLD